MRGQVVEIYKTFESASRSLVVPVYQRNYDWQVKHCSQLLDDLVELARSDGERHFFGAIVGDPEDSWTWTIIDGQQRLTTVSLMMLALAAGIDNGSVPTADPGLADKLRRSYLIEDGSESKPRFKLKPVKDDAEAYARLFEGDGFIQGSNITNNYSYFLDEFPKTGLTAEQLWGAICGLEVMHLDLQKDDSPQRIFESLNSTGLELSEADKVRNLLLMGLPHAEQTDLYEHFWNRMEKNVAFETTDFLRWYLVAKTRSTPRKDAVYEAFKAYMKSEVPTSKELAKDLRRYSEHYRNYYHPDTGSKRIDRRLERLSLLGSDVVLPFVMSLLDGLAAGEVTGEEVEQSLRIVESYLFRRFAASVPTNALNKIFASLYQDVKKLRGAEDSFTDVLTYSLRRREDSGRFPTDAEFRDGFLSRNFYSGPSGRRAYVFEVLENRDSNDIRDIAGGLENDTISVEHIMPQTLTPGWQEALGADWEATHAKHKDRLGNLTVTGYNSKYSNSSFLEKLTTKDGFKESPYRLNHYVREQTEWGPQQIEERAQRLLADAMEYWALPSTDFTPPVRPLPTQSMGTDNDFTNREIVAYEFKGAGGTVTSWREAFIGIIRELAIIDRQKVIERAKKGAWYHLGPNSEAPKGFWEADPALSVYVETSTRSKMEMLRDLFDVVGADPDDVVFTLKPRPQDVQETQDEVQNPYAEALEVAIVASGSSAPPGSEAAQGYSDAFLSAFTPHRVPDVRAVLGAPPATFVQDTAQLKGASEEQLLALVSSILDLSEQYDPDALWRNLSDGTVARYLGRI